MIYIYIIYDIYIIYMIYIYIIFYTNSDFWCTWKDGEGDGKDSAYCEGLANQGSQFW